MQNKIPLISSLSESDLFVEDCSGKSREEWIDELLAFGLTTTYNGNCFGIPRQANPLNISLADDKYAPRVGYNPRIYVPRVAANDKTFMKIISDKKINVVNNFGHTFKGYDFQDRRSVAELGSFLVWFEKEYIDQAMLSECQ